ncbi:hypothetical protein [Sulfurimonas sp.]|jgi:hypothetical protein|uniref:hypothetical protein n=1 Tax=Sulfurimonas sp. TaxID=2022749 RepID=UPI0025F413A2|nr:hypothetical protein [Sulfurimonas sp.]MBT5933764.1 hypothetical protein [Sulfurimonas sp.]
MNNLALICIALLFSSSLFGFGTSKSSKKRDAQRICTIRLFTTNSVQSAVLEMSRLSIKLQDEIEIFTIKNSEMVVGQTGKDENCRALRPLLQEYRSKSFKDAYFINYNPKKTSLTLVGTTRTSNENKEIEEDEQISSSVLNQKNNGMDEFLDSLKNRGTVGAIFNSYSTDKTEDTLALEGSIDLSKSFDWGAVSSNFVFLYDFSDNRRRYIVVNELYAKYYMDEAIVQIGRSINTWGLLEGYSMSDIFNTKNYLSDSFDTSNKYGAFNAEYTKLIDDHKFSVLIKAEEMKQPYPAEDNVYNFYNYGDALDTKAGEYRPTVYLKYSGLSGDTLESEYTVILQNGYDNKRDIVASIASGEVTQIAYLVNKAVAYLSVTYWDVIYKFEAAYTDVLDYSNMSDYVHYGLGFEYVPSVTIGGAELRVLSEYYQYQYFEDDKSENKDLSEMFQNDIFIGVQSSFGDAGSSEIKSGVLYDLENREQTYALSFGTRMKESYRLSMEWKVFIPGDDSNTAIGRMGQFNQATFRANYFF